MIRIRREGVTAPGARSRDALAGTIRRAIGLAATVMALLATPAPSVVLLEPGH